MKLEVRNREVSLEHGFSKSKDTITNTYDKVYILEFFTQFLFNSFCRPRNKVFFFTFRNEETEIKKN